MSTNEKNIVEAIEKLREDLNTKLDMMIELLEDIKKGA
jgi:hypothetical protein